MATDKIKWNMDAFQELRREPGVKAELKKHADALADKAGPQLGYLAFESEGRSRSRAGVVTSNGVAMTDNAHNQTLLKALAEYVAEHG